MATRSKDAFNSMYRRLTDDQIAALRNPNVSRRVYRDGSEQIEVGIAGAHVTSAYLALGSTSFTFDQISSPEYVTTERLYELASALRAFALLTEIKARN